MNSDHENINDRVGHEPGRRIRYLQLETGTVCNYRCVYCPVSFAPRRGGYMELDVVRSVVDQLATSAPLQEVYLNGYDEPTLNRRLPAVAEPWPPWAASWSY